MIRELLLIKSDSFIVQFVRYGLVAGIAFIIDFGLLFVFTRYLHIYYLASATLSFSISLVANYLLSVGWVFRRAENASRGLEIPLFALIGFIGLGLNDLIIWAFTVHAHTFYLVSKLIATVIVFFWSFLARKYFLFKS